MTLNTKVYFQDKEAFNILWERLITWFDENTMINFSDNLQKYIIYLKDLNEQEKLIWKWYKEISWIIINNEIWFLSKK